MLPLRIPLPRLLVSFLSLEQAVVRQVRRSTLRPLYQFLGVPTGPLTIRNPTGLWMMLHRTPMVGFRPPLPFACLISCQRL